jgi:signal transduction histidine kinase
MFVALDFPGQSACQLVTANAAMVNEISDQIRNISHLLHPPLLDEIGLPSAVRWYVDGLRSAARSGRLSKSRKILTACHEKRKLPPSARCRSV